jgi:mono/diheme cytochrome c family protein
LAIIQALLARRLGAVHGILPVFLEAIMIVHCLCRHCISLFTLRLAGPGLLVALLLAACSDLGGEPRIVATFPPATSVPETNPPAARPDIMLGAAIFAENCTRCHGIGGQGDGELVLTGQLPDAPPDFTDEATARDMTLVEWYEIITHGRLERFMPPWRDSLSESERWAVARVGRGMRGLPR